jgi:Domain of unknown function (DUF4410)
MRSMITIAAFAVLLGGSALAPLDAQNRPRTIKEGILDEAELYVDKLPAVARVAIRPFSATDADITEGEKKDETKKMQVDAPPMLAARFAEKLKEFGPFTEVTTLDASGTAPADTLLVEGQFVEMDPGSRAKRYLVGFGAGKSGVTVEGSVRAPDGMLLATFKQRRIGVMGAAGGDSMGKLVSDTKDIAEDIAKFLSAWAKGQKLDD